MAFEANGQIYGTFTKKASETNVKRYRFVAQEGKTIKAPADGGAAMGVCLLKDPKDGQETAVQYDGIAMVEASAAIAADAEVETGTDGRAETRSSGVKLGMAVEAAGAAGDVIAVRLYRN